MSLMLPIEAPPSSRSIARQNRPRAAVLVIDDESDVRDFLAFLLLQYGFEVATADSGKAAVKAVEAQRFDIALTDIRMPGMDGLATLLALREVQEDIQVIVATGYAQSEEAIACLKLGACGLLQKPFDIAELKLLIDRILKRHEGG